MPTTQRYYGHLKPMLQDLLRDARHKDVRHTYRERGHGDAVPSASDRIVSINSVGTAAVTPRLVGIAMEGHCIGMSPTGRGARIAGYGRKQ
jgi:hypothetical protein